MNGSMSASGWSLHPQPLEEESLTSWVMRQANANWLSYRTFVRCYIGPGEWRRRDIDLLDGDILVRLAEGGNVAGREARLRQMTLSRWLSVIGPTCQADRHSWISSLYTARYCNECIIDDPIPHLRHLWRLHSVLLCTRHLVMLRKDCDRCGRPVMVSQFLPEEGLPKCKSCGSELCKTSSLTIQNCERSIQFAKAQPEILDTGRVPTRFGPLRDGRDFFDALRFLMRFQSLRFQSEKSTIRLRSRSPDWRKNQAMAAILMDESLALIEDWPVGAARLLNDNRPYIHAMKLRSIQGYAITQLRSLTFPNA